MTMTKKLVWRLKEQPTTEKLEALVKAGILKNEEAREILFTHEEIGENPPMTAATEDALRAEIKFLREMVDKLSESKVTKIVETIKEVRLPYWRYEWYKPYEVWCNGANTYLNNANTGGLSINSAMEQANNLVSNFLALK